MASPDLLHFVGSFERRNAFCNELLAVPTPMQGGIKTNGSLIRSHSGPSVVSEQKPSGSPRPALKFAERSITNPTNLALKVGLCSPRLLEQNSRDEEDYDEEESDHFLALYSNSVPSNFDLVIKATGDACAMEENDVDEPPSQMLLSECPEFIPYLNPPSPAHRSDCDNLPDVNSNSIGEQVNTDDEIIYGFRSVDSHLRENGGGRPAEGAEECDFLWELIETRRKAEAGTEGRSTTSLRNSDISELSKIQSGLQRKPLTSPKTKQVAYKPLGVETLMDCAADELDRLRVGAVEAVRRRPVASSTPVDDSSHPAARRREEKTQSTTGTLVSLLQIQLTELRRMAETVSKEFNNQLAHERALLELLELEHERVQTEVNQAGRKGQPPPDLINHLRHLKDRLEQQTALIDDLEYQYLEEKTKYEEERETLLVQLRLHQDSPMSRSNCEAPCNPSPVGALSTATDGAPAESHASNVFFDRSKDTSVHPSHPEGPPGNSNCHADDVLTTSTPSTCNGLTPSTVFPHSQSYTPRGPVEPPYSPLLVIGAEGSPPTMTPGFSVSEARKPELQQIKNGRKDPQQQHNGKQASWTAQNATIDENDTQFTRSQASMQVPQTANSGTILSQGSNQDAAVSSSGVYTQKQSIQPQPFGHSHLEGLDFVCQPASGSAAPLEHPQAHSGGDDNIEPYQSFPSGCYYQQRQRQMPFSAMDEESKSQPLHSSQSTVVTLSSQGPECGSSSGGGGADGDGLGLACPDRQIFHAVPPLPPGSGAAVFTTTPSFVSAPTPPSAHVINCNNQEKTVMMRTRTVSAGRRTGMDAEARPLTRYLPVPDDISFDLRNHLESICGHTLCSPTLSEQVCVETTCCSGFLYKIDSTLSHVFASPHEVDAFASPATSRRRPPIGGGGIKGGLGGLPHSSSSSVMGSAFSFFRRRPRRRRWFVLDRRRRLLTYYAIQGTKAPATPLKPKDVISFADIIDVYPDHTARSGHDSHSSSFCLLLMANTSLLAESNAGDANGLAHPARSRIQTRVLSLAAPSPEAMRVWVDALFTCAGAYLCLPSRCQWPAS
nr:unnamed protein product [Spirometra erinaceieuropaei]